MAEPTQLRDVFNSPMIRAQARRLKQAWGPFDQEGFLAAILPKLQALSFGDRSKLITLQLHQHLPKDYPQALAILLDSLPDELKTENLSGQEGNFILWPMTRYVSQYGIEDFERSMQALKMMTKCFSAESDLRYFIQRYPQKTLERLGEWALDENLHVRRLVSEGIRPRLPLCMALPEFKRDPAPVLRLLEGLKEDPALYVRRSVANCLNDIAKDNPDACVETLQQWREIRTRSMDWIISHALRSLIKQGHPGALALLGFTIDPKVEVEEFRILNDRLRLGTSMEFSFDLRSTSEKEQHLVVDFVIHFVKKSGKLAPKVFKLSTKHLAAGDCLSFAKAYLLVQRSTRVHYPGLHRLEIQVGGQILAGLDFTLEF